jgi:hypothetical protein
VTDLFISYSQPDRECAFDLVAALERDGFRCWIAPRDIEPASDWAAEIIEAISRARMMILVFSAGSNQSPQVRREVERAVHKQLPILPFRIEDVVPSKSLEYFLSAQHWMDAFPPPREPHYRRLCAYLRAHLATPDAPRASADVSGTYSMIAAKTSLFQAADLRHFEAQLAQHIGPLARHLVKQAALQATSIEDLLERLGAEIEGQGDRRRFLALCRRDTPT